MVKVINKLGETVRVWVSTHNVFKGSLESWYTIEAGKSETWSRSATNTVNIDYRGAEYSILTSGYDTFVLTKDGILRAWE